MYECAVVGVAVALLTLSVAKGDQTVVWDASATPAELGNGALVLSYDGANRVQRIDVNPAIGGPLTVSGDAMTFAEHAKICLTGEGTAVFDIAATAPAGLTVDSSLHNQQTELAWSRDTPLLREEVAEIPAFSDVDLSQYRLEAMSLNTAGLSNINISPNTPGHPCHQVVSNFEGRTFLDAQIHNDTRDTTKWLKCIKVRLVQDNGQVTARVLWAKYADRSLCGSDFDFENPGSVELKDMSVPTRRTDGGYSVDCLNLSRISSDSSPVRCVFRKPLDLTGPLVITNCVTVEARTPQGLFTDDTSVANDISIFNGCLVFADRDKVLLGSHIQGKRGTVAFRNDETLPPLQSLVFRYSNPDVADPSAAGKINDPSWHVFLANARLSTVTNITSKLSNSGLNGTENVSLFRYRHEGTNASVEVQHYYWTGERAVVRAATLELRQNGLNIEIRRARTYFVRDENLSQALFKTGYVTYETATQSGDYDLTGIDIYCSEDPRLRKMNVTLSGANGCSKGSLAFGVPDDPKSAYGISIAHKDGFPANGSVDVYGGASKMTITHKDQVASTGTGWSSSVKMHEGSTLVSPEMFSWGAQGPLLVLDGGRAQLKAGSGSIINYANQMTVMGAAVEGSTLFCGYGVDGVWSVRGAAPSVLTASEIRTGATSATVGRWILDVADVTGDDAVDLEVNAPVTRHADRSLFPEARIVKRGEGSVSWTKRITGELAAIRLEAGTWMLGSDQVFSASDNNLVFAGGTLSVKTGVDAVIGSVRLERDSAIVIPDGASLSLSAQPDAEWSADELAIVGPQKPGHSIRFGTSPAALTVRQVRKIRYNDKQVRLDKDGYLLTEPFGLTVIFR